MSTELVVVFDHLIKNNIKNSRSNSSFLNDKGASEGTK